MWIRSIVCDCGGRASLAVALLVAGCSATGRSAPPSDLRACLLQAGVELDETVGPPMVAVGTASMDEPHADQMADTRALAALERDWEVLLIELHRALTIPESTVRPPTQVAEAVAARVEASLTPLQSAARDTAVLKPMATERCGLRASRATLAWESMVEAAAKQSGRIEAYRRFKKTLVKKSETTR